LRAPAASIEWRVVWRLVGLALIVAGESRDQQEMTKRQQATQSFPAWATLS